jgi:hypothetical protein
MLNPNFSTNLNLLIIKANSWADDLDLDPDPDLALFDISETRPEQKSSKELKSSVQWLVPLLKTVGFSLIDLSQLSKLATPKKYL